MWISKKRQLNRYPDGKPAQPEFENRIINCFEIFSFTVMFCLFVFGVALNQLFSDCFIPSVLTLSVPLIVYYLLKENKQREEILAEYYRELEFYKQKKKMATMFGSEWKSDQVLYDELFKSQVDSGFFEI